MAGKTSNKDVSITSPTTIPKDNDVVISWKTKNPNEEIKGFEIRIGTAAGDWNVFECRLGGALTEVKIPFVPADLTKLFVEFGYVVPFVEQATTAQLHHHSTENVLLDEAPFEISRT